MAPYAPLLTLDRTVEHIVALEAHPTLEALPTTKAILQAWLQRSVVRRDTAGMPGR